MNILAHTSFVGTTGYNNHSRDFFTALNKLLKVKVRNYTVGKSWLGMSHEPHNGEWYITDEHKDMLYQQILHTSRDVRVDEPMYSYDPNYKVDKHIVLNETNHYVFYDEYKGYKIAYNVWETTLYPNDYFKKLLEFDELWVPSKWQMDCAIAQGYPSHKVKIVHEGVDASVFHPENKRREGKFQFLIAGRWDYRKSTKEIIQSWLNVFMGNEDVELLLLVDNPYSVDGLNSTEERLEVYNLQSKNIKVVHFLSREEYIETLKQTDVFISCARSEGWNLPLMEAMACGIPSLYSDWGAQLEFAYRHGVPVNIIDERPANIGKDTFHSDIVGNYCEPDFKDLEAKLKDVYYNHGTFKNKALQEAEVISALFSWENAANTAFQILNKKKSTNTDVECVDREICVVSAYTDTKEKEELLLANIEQLKNLGYKVLLSSHYPIKDEIVKKVDYYVYDSHNYVIPLSDYRKHNMRFEYWMDLGEIRIHQPFPYHYSYNVWTLFKNAANFINNLGQYKKIHYIDYDCLIEDVGFLPKHSSLLDERDAVFYHFDNKKNGGYFTVLFSINLSTALQVFNTYNNLDSYLHNKYGDTIIEGVVNNLVSDYGISHYIFERHEVEANGNKIDLNKITSSLEFKSLVDNEFTEYSIFHKSHSECILLIRDKVGSANYKIDVDGNVIELNIGNDYSVFSIIKKTNYNVEIYRDNILIINSRHYFDDDYYYNNYITAIGDNVLPSTIDNSTIQQPLSITHHFVGGAFLEIKGGASDAKYKVKFIDKDTNIVEYENVIGRNCWCVSNKKYVVNWLITVESEETNEIIFKEEFDPKGKRVYIAIGSKSLGDSLAWIPAVEDFRKKHDCTVICSTFMNTFLEKHYPELHFIEAGSSVEDIYAMFEIAWVYDGDNLNKNNHPNHVRIIPLQKTAYDILGLDYVETKPLTPLRDSKKKKKQVVIAIHSTCQAKYWNHENGWQDVVDYLTKRKYKVVLISKEDDGHMGNKHPIGVIKLKAGSIERAREEIEQSELFVGVGSGLSWLAWTTSTPTVIISGFSYDFTEPSTVRVVAPTNVCRGCFQFNKLDAGDWNWCPINKGTEKQFECSKSITSAMVIKEIEKLL